MRPGLFKPRLAVIALAVSLSSVFGFAPAASAFRDRDCSDFRTQRQAQRFFRHHNPRLDPHRLDADRDGIACEALA